MVRSEDGLYAVPSVHTPHAYDDVLATGVASRAVAIEHLAASTCIGSEGRGREERARDQGASGGRGARLHDLRDGHLEGLSGGDERDDGLVQHC